ncbi:MAG: hypothetical protein U0457_16595 [Candidatus Sericytochromatia bacterium]
MKKIILLLFLTSCMWQQQNKIEVVSKKDIKEIKTNEIKKEVIAPVVPISEKSSEKLNPLPVTEEKKEIKQEIIKENKPITNIVINNPSQQSSTSYSNTFMPSNIKPITTEQIKAEFISSGSNSPKFDIIKDVKEGTRNAYITLFFKSEKKIRAESFESKIFKSLTSSDINNLNKLIKDYNVKTLETTDSALTKSEAQLEYEKAEAEKLYGSYYPNKADIFYLFVENINVKEFIEKLREDINVLSANETN